MLPGCFGYNRGAKGWSYVGNTFLIAGGGAAIAVDRTTTKDACTGTGCMTYSAPFSGMLLTGAIFVTAGLVGIVLNATRPNVKGSSH